MGGKQQQSTAERMVTHDQGGDDDERPRLPVTETAPASAMGAFGTDHPKLIGKVLWFGKDLALMHAGCQFRAAMAPTMTISSSMRQHQAWSAHW